MKESITSCAATGISNVSLCVIPVNLFHPSSPEKIITTLALLDNGTQGSFIHNDIIDELSISTVKTSLEIQTINGKMYERSSIVSGLQVSQIEDSTDSITLPKLYSRSSLPTSFNELPSPKLIKSWPHLNKVNLPAVTGISTIGLLIGANCPKALEPLEVIKSRNNGPFAIRTKLGWCVSGPMYIENPSTGISCYRAKVNQQNKDDFSPFFRIKECIKDKSLKDMITVSQGIEFQ